MATDDLALKLPFLVSILYDYSMKKISMKKISVILLFLCLVAQTFYLKENLMAHQIFIPPADPLLNMRAKEVPLEEILSDEVQADIERMLRIAGGERGDTEKRVMVGLAAPQVGISKRIILVDMGIGSDRKELGKLSVFINPEITWYSPEFEEGREACYSVDGRVAGIVSRAKAIAITAYDREGNPVASELSGFTARIFQHEVDHLEGIRFPDRVGPDGKLHWVEEWQYPDYRNQWQSWPCTCSWDRWVVMKEGHEHQ